MLMLMSILIHQYTTPIVVICLLLLLLHQYTTLIVVICLFVLPPIVGSALRSAHYIFFAVGQGRSHVARQCRVVGNPHVTSL